MKIAVLIFTVFMSCNEPDNEPQKPIEQTTSDFSEDSTQLAWENRMRPLLFRINPDTSLLEQQIVAMEDSMFLLDTIQKRYSGKWYLKFKKNFHPQYK